MIKPTKHTPNQIRDIIERVYRQNLDNECGDGTAKMTDDAIAKGILGTNGKPRLSIRERAASYDKLTRVYLDVLGIKP